MSDGGTRSSAHRHTDVHTHKRTNIHTHTYTLARDRSEHGAGRGDQLARCTRQYTHNLGKGDVNEWWSQRTRAASILISSIFSYADSPSSSFVSGTALPLPSSLLSSANTFTTDAETSTLPNTTPRSRRLYENRAMLTFMLCERNPRYAMIVSPRVSDTHSTPLPSLSLTVLHTVLPNLSSLARGN